MSYEADAAVHGEFSPLDGEAREAASALDFAIAHKAAVRSWGYGPKPTGWECVTVDGTDYLWHNGHYDGWKRPIGGAPSLADAE